MNTNIRTIHTGLYGAYAKEIIDAVSGQLSDGKYENTPGYDKYWTNFHVRQADDGEIVFDVNADSHCTYCSKWLVNPFIDMTDMQFKAWYARKLKAVIQDEGRDENWAKGWWNRTSHYASCYLNYKLDVTVADVYYVYESLLERDVKAYKYEAATIARVAGVKKTDEEASKAKSLREAKELIYAKYAQLIKDATAHRDEELAKVTKELFDKCRATVEKLQLDQKAEIASLEQATA